MRSSTHRRLVRRTPTGLALLLVLLAGAGCDAGDNSLDSQPAVSGADANVGGIELRDLVVPYQADGYPAGSDVPLIVRMINSGENAVTVAAAPGPPQPADTLTVTTTNVAVRGSGTAGAQDPLSVAPGQQVDLLPDSPAYLVAERISGPLTYGWQVSIQFTASTGESTTVPVPMAPPGQNLD